MTLEPLTRDNDQSLEMKERGLGRTFNVLEALLPEGKVYLTRLVTKDFKTQRAWHVPAFGGCDHQRNPVARLWLTGHFT